MKKGQEVRVSVLTEKPEDLSFVQTMYSLAGLRVINSNLEISNIKAVLDSNDPDNKEILKMFQPFLSFTIENLSTDMPATLELSGLTFKLSHDGYKYKNNVNCYVHVWGNDVAKQYNPYKYKRQKDDLKTLYMRINTKKPSDVPMNIIIDNVDEIFTDFGVKRVALALNSNHKNFFLEISKYFFDIFHIKIY